MRSWLAIGLFALVLAAAEAGAQTRYVSDELVITFRTGPSSQNAVTRNLTSGDRVEVLEELPDEGYTRVRLPDGEEGWVLTRYLQDEPTAALRLETATSQLAAARQRAAALEARVEELTAELEATSQALSESRSGAAAVSAQLEDVREASASALATREQNENLRRRVAELSTEAEVAEMEIDELRRRERQNWFVIGAAVLFGGIIIGLVAPSLRRRRRSSW